MMKFPGGTTTISGQYSRSRNLLPLVRCSLAVGRLPNPEPLRGAVSWVSLLLHGEARSFSRWLPRWPMAAALVAGSSAILNSLFGELLVADIKPRNFCIVRRAAFARPVRHKRYRAEIDALVILAYHLFIVARRDLVADFGSANLASIFSLSLLTPASVLSNVTRSTSSTCCSRSPCP